MSKENLRNRGHFEPIREEIAIDLENSKVEFRRHLAPLIKTYRAKLAFDLMAKRYLPPGSRIGHSARRKRATLDRSFSLCHHSKRPFPRPATKDGIALSTPKRV